MTKETTKEARSETTNEKPKDELKVRTDHLKELVRGTKIRGQDLSIPKGDIEDFRELLCRWIDGKADYLSKNLQGDYERAKKRRLGGHRSHFVRSHPQEKMKSLEVLFGELQEAFDKSMTSFIGRLCGRINSDAEDDFVAGQYIGQVVLCVPRKSQTSNRHFCRVLGYNSASYFERYHKALKDYLEKGSTPTLRVASWLKVTGVKFEGIYTGDIKISSATIGTPTGMSNCFTVEPILREDGAPSEVLATDHHNNQIEAYRVNREDVELSSLDDMFAAFVVHNSQEA